MGMTVELENLEVECVIGDLPEERLSPRRISLDIRLETPDVAAATDDLRDAADYAALAGAVRAALREAKCALIERAARIAAETCLAAPNVLAATAKVRKTGCVEGLGAASAVFRLEKKEKGPSR